MSSLTETPAAARASEAVSGSSRRYSVVVASAARTAVTAGVALRSLRPLDLGLEELAEVHHGVVVVGGAAAI